ncbi:MAG: class I SAM-dependent methyltransferase [Nitrososphaerales archaeon]
MNGTEIYSPREDSVLLRDAIALADAGGRLLEIGCGSACNLRWLEKFGLVVGTDLLSFKVLKKLKNGQEFDLIAADKASCFRNGVFDVVAFNPPYLPSEVINDLAVDGGKNGLEVPMAFLVEGLRVSKPDSSILMILSSETDMTSFKNFCFENNLIWSILLEENLFFETLVAILVQRDKPSSNSGARNGQ